MNQSSATFNDTDSDTSNDQPPSKIFGQRIETFTLESTKHILVIFNKQGSIRKTSTLQSLLPELIDLESKVTFHERSAVAILLLHKQPITRAALSKEYDVAGQEVFTLGRRTCQICYEDLPARMFRKGYANYEVGGLSKHGQMLANYKEYMSTYALRNLPGFSWCLSPGCRSGQVHLPGDESPKMTCQKCGFDTCYSHQLPWHDGKACEEVGGLKLKEDRESEAWIKSQTKACPNCGVATIKAGGCGGIYCRCDVFWDFETGSIIA
ncbi:eb94bcc9-cad7-41a9-849c-74c7425788e2 [Sclerotinia trifoliorum]|uniref:Eb94bcc9-cad7-41a9-849c-74c7425788e2 n=1 Tax=Sclerotinia trifoliorum TaxID=28548 RepID=A0A8H2W134_9HELO|nr:eb94bcc9-cad7-41a9-849c-74c7425788e2 [Sclerotinia trifoliorum]